MFGIIILLNSLNSLIVSQLVFLGLLGRQSYCLQIIFTSLSNIYIYIFFLLVRFLSNRIVIQFYLVAVRIGIIVFFLILMLLLFVH